MPNEAEPPVGPELRQRIRPVVIQRRFYDDRLTLKMRAAFSQGIHHVEF